MSDNENNNKDLKPGGGSSPPTDQDPKTDATAVGSETTDTSSAEEENQQAPSTDNDNDESQGQETEGGEEPNEKGKEDENPNKENNNDLPDKIGNSVGKAFKEGMDAWKATSNTGNDKSLGDQMKDLNEVQVDKAFVSDSINLLGKISFDELIGNPLRAAVKAQRDLAKETLSYIREEGIKVDENGQGQITYVTMNFFRDGKQVKMRVPLLTLMPVPRLSISTMSYTFKAKVNAMSGVVASVGSGGTPINAGMSTDNSSKSAASAKATTNSSSKGNNEKTGDEPAASTDNSAVSSNKTAASATGTKSTISTTPTMSVGYSSKKDSGATRDSRYSVETTMDISITASEGEMPRGIDRLLGVLDDSTEVIDPKGTLQVSADRISLVNNYGTISVSYRNGKGAYAPTDVTCEPIEGEAKPDMLESGDEMLLIFKAKGVYMVSAGELTRIVFVS